MDENISRLQAQLAAMNDQDRALAQVYIDRIGKMKALFHFAQTVIASIVARTLAEGLPVDIEKPAV